MRAATDRHQHGVERVFRQCPARRLLQERTAPRWSYASAANERHMRDATLLSRRRPISAQQARQLTCHAALRSPMSCASARRREVTLMSHERVSVRDAIRVIPDECRYAAYCR